jgi:transcriptional regulator with XRE-family HTH domain
MSESTTLAVENGGIVPARLAEESSNNGSNQPLSSGKLSCGSQLAASESEPDSADTSLQFGDRLRHWRGLRHMSQNDLALAANVSSRHISFLETGRARPSRKMVLRLSEVLDLPFRARNELLACVNHRAGFSETPLTDEKLSNISETLNFLLASHDPLPAFVLDQNWNVIRANRAATRILSILMDGVAAPKASTSNVIDWLVQEGGLNTILENWQEIGVELVRRVHKRGEVSGSDPSVHNMLSKLVGALENSPPNSKKKTKEEFILPIKVRKSGLALNFYSTVTKVGDPRDITLQELSLETLCPADNETRQLLISLSKLTP